jgi:hypothetical protein
MRCTLNESSQAKLEGSLPRYLSDDRPVRDFEARQFVTTGGNVASEPPGSSQLRPKLDPRGAAQPTAVLEEVNGNSRQLLQGLLTASLQLSQMERALTPEERLLLSVAMQLHHHLADRAKAILDPESPPSIEPKDNPPRGGRIAKRAPQP